ncbi:UNVERIFIED_CONTAM: hypothetical protein Sradi_3812800 [Sesamum radiatum]|uniref:Uncharacterized protein n=1 Tax=Sesamum radiatum TaxID=300843 RepID=A0AAW2Q0T0_SESRA
MEKLRIIVLCEQTVVAGSGCRNGRRALAVASDGGHWLCDRTVGVQRRGWPIGRAAYSGSCARRRWWLCEGSA